MKVYWTDRAKRRLKLIEEYIAQDAPEVAQRTVHRILARSRQIGELPQSGRKVPEFDHPEIREVLQRPYRIIYRVRSDRIDVLAVMHYRQLLPRDRETVD